MPDNFSQEETNHSSEICPALLKSLGLDETAWEMWRTYVNDQILYLDKKHGLAEETGNGDWPSEGDTSLLKGSSGRHYSKSKMKNSHSYNGTMDLLDTHMKSPWSSSNSGSYMERYQKSSSNGFLADGHPTPVGKGDKGFTLLPNKYPSHSSSNGELPSLSSPFNHHNSHATFGDFNSNLWSQHEEFMGFNNNNHHKGGFSTANSKPSKHGRQLHPPLSHDKYSDSSRRFDAFSQNNTSIDQSDSDHEPYPSHRPSYQNYGQGEGHFIKINREYDDIDEDDGKKDGLDSAGSSNTRDSGIPSPPSMGGGPYEARQSAPKMTSSKKKSPSPQLGHPSESLSHSRSWRSTPDVPELAKADDDSRKSNEIGSDISRSQSGSSGFLHRKPVLARASQRKTSSDSIQNRLSGLELRDFDDGTESESQQYIKEKIQKPVSYHLSLSTNNIANSEEDEVDKSKMPYSTSSLRRNTSNKAQTKPYLKSRSRSRTPVGNRGLTSEISSGKGDAESLTSLTESSPPKNNLTVKKGTMPKRVYKGSFRDSNGRNAMNTMNVEVFPADLKPVDSPRHSLSLALNNLNSSEWETNLDGFRLLVRLSRHHPESLRNDLHNININGMRHLLNLRSQVCRAACLFFKELFLSQGKLIEQDVEKIAEKLLDKSSDTNRFIREDSGSAIETMVLNLTPAKILHCLDTYGLKHRNPMVRTVASRMLTLLIRRLGSERSLYDHPEKILPMIMHFLQEGSLDTRTHAKAALAELVQHKGFDSQLRRHVSQDTLRNVSKSIAAIKNEVCRLNESTTTTT
ncbi:unnamed protein product [Allacma fusca]|uniref:TOG domain-containing protein n=1 Tax=Allacma fusca TaxID=39272 RepID=A0A8J2K5X0_9HEXA|nr:unnamed protein product [Allacma fusca]